MNIYESEPTDWRDLQLKVSEILSTIGFDCTIEKDIETVRGTVKC